MAQKLVDAFYDATLQLSERLDAYESLKQWPNIFQDVTLHGLWGYVSNSATSRWSVDIRKGVWQCCDRDGWTESFKRRVRETLRFEDGVCVDEVYHEVVVHLVAQK